MIVPKLTGKALTTFKAYRNHAGDTNNALTTTWVEFIALFETLIPNDLAESLKIENDYDKAFQSGSADKFVDVYKSLVARIRANDESMTLHSDKTLRTKFLKKLKASVQLHFDRSKLDTLENAYAEAIRADSLVYSASVQERSSPAKNPNFRTFNSPSAGGSPRAGAWPKAPPAVLALLAHLNLNWDGSQIQGGSSPPSASSLSQGSTAPGSPTLSAMEKDHSVAAGQPIPKLTPEVKEWCIKHKVCFCCCVKNTTHSSAECPRFLGVPDRNNFRLSTVDVDAQDVSENGE